MISMYRDFFLVEAPTNSAEDALRQRLVGINQYYYHKADVQTVGGKRTIKPNAVPAYVRNKNGKLEKFNAKVHHNPNAAPPADAEKDSTPAPAPQQSGTPLTRAEVNKSRSLLITGVNPLIGTAGSAVGEMFGVQCAEQFLSGIIDKFFKGHASQLKDMTTKLQNLSGASKKAADRYMSSNGFSLDDLAKQEVWVNEQYNTLKQYKGNKASLINRIGELECKEWLRVAFRTGVAEARALKSNSQADYNPTQDQSFPLGIVVNSDGRKQLLEHLKSQLESNRPHYQRQIDILNHLQDTDSAILYKDSSGNYRIWHISNKKTFSDPHLNTYPSARFELMKSRVDEVLGDIPDRQLILEDVIHIAKNISEKIREATAGVGYIGSFLWKNSKTPQQKKELLTATAVLLRELPDQVVTKRRDGVEKILKRNGPIRKYIAEYEASTKKKASDIVYAEAMFKLLSGELTTKSGKSVESSAGVLLAITKISQLVDTARELAASGQSPAQISTKLKLSPRATQIALDSKGLYNRLYGVASDFKDQSAAIHSAAVSQIQKRDEMWRRKHPSAIAKDANGPASQLYVDSFLKSMHWYDYLSGQLDSCKSINVGGKSISPKNFRECIQNLANYKQKVTSKQEVLAFNKFLREKIRISSKPGDAHISFDSQEHGAEPVKLGKEVYRSKGEQTPILGYMGRDLISCLDK